ncbi:hypothetical protein PQ43W_21 [Ralstonia phage PQ43W]
MFNPFIGLRLAVGAIAEAARRPFDMELRLPDLPGPGKRRNGGSVARDKRTARKARNVRRARGQS